MAKSLLPQILYRNQSLSAPNACSWVWHQGYTLHTKLYEMVNIYVIDLKILGSLFYINIDNISENLTRLCIQKRATWRQFLNLAKTPQLMQIFFLLINETLKRYARGLKFLSIKIKVILNASVKQNISLGVMQ